MDEAVRVTVEQLPEVRWVGLLQPAYKLFPFNLLGAGPRTIIVVLHPGESDGAFEARAKELGGTNFIWDINEVNKSVRFDVDAFRIPEIASLTEVDWIEPWTEWGLDNVDAQWVTQMGWRPAAPPPTERIIWQKGVQGDWMEGSTYRYAVIGHVDDGLDPRHCAFIDPAVPITTSGDFPTHRKIIAYYGTIGQTMHGTHTAGSACGNDGSASYNDGMALMAKLFHKTYPGSSWDMNTWWGDMYQGNAGGRAYSMTMSLDRKDSFNLYVFTDMTADQFHWRYKDFIETNSCGNYGSNYMGHPAVAKDNITIGAVQNGINSNQIHPPSSRGSCADGRRKPNLMAPGASIMSAQYSTACSYSGVSATSMSCAVGAGNVALVRCYFEKGFYPTGDSVPVNRYHPSGALIKAVLTVGADSNIVDYTVPDNNIGWGRIDLDSSLYFAGDVKRLWVYDDTTIGLRTGDSTVHTISVTNSNHPFRVVMCYSDTAGPMRASRTLVNDLDLTVISPGGPEYLGNVWSGGQSQTGGLRDSIQETECFRLNSPPAGTWTIKVKANNVPAGGSKGQPYALAATGAVSGSGVEEPASKEPVPLREFSLGPASPNPMHKWTEISFFLPQASPVSLRVFSVTGQLVKVLADGPHDAGSHRVPWDGQDFHGMEVASGVYFYRLEAEGFSGIGKLIVVR
jgi:hypothetical protein